MTCSTSHIHKMEKIQERALSFLLDNFSNSYNDLLVIAGYDSLQLKRMKTIACEVFKSLNSLNPSFMRSMFVEKDNIYDLRDGSRLVQPSFNKIRYGKNTFSYYGSHLWNMLPANIKNCATDMKMFKQLISTWQGPNCQCSMCTLV